MTYGPCSSGTPIPVAKQERDAHVKPPDSFKSFYKRYQNISLKNLDSDRDVIDFSNLDDLSQDNLRLKRTVEFPYSTAQRCGFVKSNSTKTTEFPAICVYEHHAIPGAHVVSQYTIHI